MSTDVTGEGLTVARVPTDVTGVPTFVSGSLIDGATNTDENALNHLNRDYLWEADGGFQYGLDIVFNDENIAQLLGDLFDELNRPTFLTRSASGDVVPSEMVSSISCSEFEFEIHLSTARDWKSH